MSTPVYEIYAVKYGERMGTRGGNLVYADPHDEPMAMDYYVWAIRNADVRSRTWFSSSLA